MAEPFRLDHNCWRKDFVRSAHLLIDGSAYYRDLYETLRSAKSSITILGWDLCSDVRLSESDQSSLAEYLKSLLNENAELRIRILIWDSFPFFQQYREPKTELLEKFSHDRLELVFDRSLALFASFHAKLIVIDQKIAYLGGIDLTANRFDEPSHLPRNSRPLEKRELNCQQFGEFFPIHDVQIRVEGPVVRSLALLAEQQWRRTVKGDEESIESIRLPPDLEFSSLENLSVAALSRTQAPWQDWPSRGEIRNLYMDLIREAKNYIYIECQYLSSRDVTLALAETLSKNTGPEIIIVTSRDYRGWWESHTLGALRNDCVKKLKGADSFYRLGIYYPGQNQDSAIAVHSKLMIIDGLYACIGSANLTNRSMYLDSELCLTIDDSRQPLHFRRPYHWTLALLSEHLNLSPVILEERLEKDPSLLNTIRSLQEPGVRMSRQLYKLSEQPEDFWSRWLKGLKWSDPDGPLRFQEKVLYKNLEEMPEIFHG